MTIEPYTGDVSETEDIILVHPDDNVVVMLSERNKKVPVGHKAARCKIKAGSLVYKYGSPIGIATRDISQGEWVHTHNLKTTLTSHPSFIYDPVQRHERHNLPDTRNMTFAGFRRNQNRTGIRNEIWIIPTVGCMNKSAEKLAAYGRSLITRNPKIKGSVDTVYAWTHAYGCSQLGEDHEMTRQILLNLACHPNAGAVLILGLGCENNQLATFRDMLGDYDDERIKFLVAQDVTDEIDVGQTIINQLIASARDDKRTACSASQLVVGLKCGASDSLSGLTANPLLGRFSERLVQAGGSPIMTEIPEMFGAEQALLNRAVNHDVYSQFSQMLQSFRDYYTNSGQPVYENPSPGNKDGGITTLEEKSLGCTQKAGKAPVNDVLRYGQVLRKTGLSILEGPGNDLISCTTLAAAGAHMLLFTTGRGNPLGGPVPTLKISSNRSLAERKRHWIDFDASPALKGENVRSDLDDQLWKLVLEVASGRQMAKNEINDEREIALFKQGVIL